MEFREVLSRKEKWKQAMLAKYGSEEAIAEFMRENQRKSRESGTFKRGGFAAMKISDPDRLSDISRKAVSKRHAKKDSNR